MKMSLIIPSWNTPEIFYRPCLQSVLNLRGRNPNNLEVIIINDGATDDTPYILREMMGKDDCTQLYLQPNSGNARTRNLGINLATGDYIAFLDCDDVILPNMLEMALKTVESGYDIYEYNMLWKVQFDVDSNAYVNHFHKRGLREYPDDIATLAFCWNKLYKTSFIKDNELHFPFSEDFPQFSDGAYRNYIRGEDEFFNNLAYAVSGRIMQEDWIGVMHINRKTSLGHTSEGLYEDNAIWAEAITHKNLFDVAIKRGMLQLAENELKHVMRLWQSCKRSKVPSEYVPDFTQMENQIKLIKK